MNIENEIFKRCHIDYDKLLKYSMGFGAICKKDVFLKH